MSEPSISAADRLVIAHEDRPGFELMESARRLGRYAGSEERLFEVMGSWVQAVPEPEVKVHLATHGPRHAWHAQLWRERLPSLSVLDVDELVAAPNDGLVAVVEVLSEPSDPRLTLEKLAGLYRVLVPQLVATYTYHEQTASPVADGPVLRSLGFVLADATDAWREGELLLQSLVRGDDQVERAAAHQTRLQRLLLDAGGIAGVGPLGSR